MNFLIGQAVAAFAMFCLAAYQAKHSRHLFGETPSNRGRFAFAAGGWVLLPITAGIAFKQYGPGVGIVVFFGWASIGAWAVSLLITAIRSRKGRI